MEEIETVFFIFVFYPVYDMFKYKQKNSQL